MKTLISIVDHILDVFAYIIMGLAVIIVTPIINGLLFLFVAWVFIDILIHLAHLL